MKDTKTATKRGEAYEQKVVYIAGPMTGYRYFNFPAFDAAEYDVVENPELVGAQWAVCYNPAQLDRDTGFDATTLPDDTNWNSPPLPANFKSEVIKRDLQALEKSDCLYMIKGWTNSTGALAEYHLATWKGLDVYYAKDAERLKRDVEAKFSDVAKEIDVDGLLAESVKELQEETGLSGDLTAAQRKGIPIATGFIDYFPDAVAAVARLSQIGNEQHNPNSELHWDRSKSGDESDALMRHFVQRGTVDSDGVRHSTKVAWRAMAALQKELEALL